MNAWLITWEVLKAGDNTLDKIAAILSSRQSAQAVARFVELLYLRSTCNASEMAYYANRRKKIPFKAQSPMIIHGVPHGDCILCGSSPSWIYARRVSKLRIQVNEKEGKEILSWVEPDTYKWKDGGISELEIASSGEVVQWERKYPMPLSKDTW